MLNIEFSQSVIVINDPRDCAIGVDISLSLSNLVVGNTYSLQIQKISQDGFVSIDPELEFFVATSENLVKTLKFLAQFARYYIIKATLVDLITELSVEDLVTIDCSEVPPEVTPTPTTTPTISPTQTRTPTSTSTETPTPTPTNTETPTATPSSTPSQTPTSSVTPSNSSTPPVTPSQTPTTTVTPSNTQTPTETPPNTPTPTVTPSNSSTPPVTPTNTPTSSITATPTPTNTVTPTSSQTPTASVTPSNTVTPTVSATQSPTPTITPTRTPTLTPTSTATTTPTPSITESVTPTYSVTPSNSPSNSVTPTNTPTPSATNLPLDECIGTDQPIYYLDCCFDNKQISAHYKFNIAFVNLNVGNQYYYEIVGTNNVKTFTIEDNFIASNFEYFTYGYLSLKTEFCEFNSFSIKLYDSNRNLLKTRSVKVDCKSEIKQNLVDCRGASFLYDESIGNVCFYFDEECRKILNITPTPTPTKTTTGTPTQTPTNTQTPTKSQTPTTTPTNTGTPTETPTPTQTQTQTSTQTSTPTTTPTQTITSTVSSTPTSTSTPTPSKVNKCSQRKYLIVRAATTQPLTFSNLAGSYRNASMTGFRQPLVIDDVSLASGDIILVKDNYGTGTWNGSDIYTVQSSGSSFAPWTLISYNPVVGTWCEYFRDDFGNGLKNYCAIYVSDGSLNGKLELLVPEDFDISPPIVSELKCADDTILREVRLATTTNLELTGLPIVDGIQTNVNDRILVKNQTDPVQNGIYVTTGISTPWQRSVDARDSLNFITTMRIYVSRGVVNRDTIWVLRRR